MGKSTTSELLCRWWVPLFIGNLHGAHPNAPRERFGGDAAPWWRVDGWVRYPWRWRRAQSDADLLHWFAVEVECLLRVAREAPGMVGSADWTGAALGACARAAQLYAELKRRHRAMPARAMLRAELRRFVEWECRAEAAPIPGD